MKKSIINILLIFLLLVTNSFCSTIQKDNETNNSEIRELNLWWSELSETWQIVFLREIDKIGKKPSEEDLLKIANLERVSCDHFPLGESNLEPLKNLKHLKSISAGSTYIQNIEALLVLDSLKYVNLADNHISDLEPLRRHKDLEELYIQMTEVEDLGPLCDKTKLQILIAFDTQIKTIKPIMELPKLSIIKVSKGNIPITELELFKIKHADCEVSF